MYLGFFRPRSGSFPESAYLIGMSGAAFTNEGNMKVTTKLKRNAEFNEWQVMVFVDGKRRSEADYFTNDKDDAKETARRIENDTFVFSEDD